MHFAGSPIRAFLPRDVTARARLRGGVNFAAYLSHGCSFSPSEYTFGGDPLEGIVLLKCGIYRPPLEKYFSLALTYSSGEQYLPRTRHDLPQPKIKDFHPGTPGRRNDAIDTSCNNRYTFGAALWSACIHAE